MSDIARLKELKLWGNKNDPDVRKEIVDIVEHLLLNGMTVEAITEATTPSAATPQRSLEQLVDEAVEARLRERYERERQERERLPLWKRITS